MKSRLHLEVVWLVAVVALGCAGRTAGGGDSALGGQGGARGDSTGMEPAARALDGGRVTLRRLNRVEYNNTVRDLLGTAKRPADAFPGDEIDFGFDTVGEAISTSPAHVEMMETAAFDLVDELLVRKVGDPIRGRVLPCETRDDACLRQVVHGFARRAFRRPVADTEIADLVGLARPALAAEGAAADDGLRAALVAVLVSPHFLFRVERDVDPAAPAAHVVSDHELATRLSYFLWTTMPDDELLQAADDGRLGSDGSDDSILRAEVERMLGDPKAAGLTENFVGQWLTARGLDQFQPMATVYPAFDETLRASMRGETSRFVDALLADNQAIETLLSADFTFIDARLARHYGMMAPAGVGPTRVSLADTPRRGLLAQASFLSVTSHSDRTSPTKRGAWILSQLLCSPPPPPPPDVGVLVTPKPGDGTTARARLEQHRGNPACAACHTLFDPLGLGLENFDGIGAYRDKDNGVIIDASGQLPDGTRFDGVPELASVLVADARFVDCAVEKALTYAVGRGFAGDDGKAYASGVASGLRTQGSGFRDLITAIVTSEAFLTRRAGSPDIN